LQITQDHWLARTRRRLSENRDPRPDSEDISLLIVHGISLPPGRFGTGLVEDLFLNRLDVHTDPSLADLADVKVSAHLFIDRRGRTTQFVPFHQRAWHAGLSEWRGRCRCNDFAIGIELEGEDQRPYTRAQYRRLTAVARALLEKYPALTWDAIVGHLEVAPDRKTDPGPVFDWSGFLASLL
jgi:AmpD protein